MSVKTSKPLISNPHRTHDRFAIRAPRRLLRARVLRCALVHGGLSAPSGWCGSIARDRGEARGVAAAALLSCVSARMTGSSRALRDAARGARREPSARRTAGSMRDRVGFSWPKNHQSLVTSQAAQTFQRRSKNSFSLVSDASTYGKKVRSRKTLRVDVPWVVIKNGVVFCLTKVHIPGKKMVIRNPRAHLSR